MTDFNIPNLISGGLITTYHCPSQCRHCLYNCSPSRSKAYMDEQTASKLFKTAAVHGARSMHIGGGEPMLDPGKLGQVLSASQKAGIVVEYVETNSSWYKDLKSAVSTLEALKEHGLQTLLVSISPFHAEYIPFEKVKGVMEACRQSGIRIFPWMDTFTEDLDKFAANKPVKFKKFKETFGEDDLSRIPERYWIHFGGRAVSTFKSAYPLYSLEQILDEAPDSCSAQLADTSHFHMDFYENYIPGLCSGLSLAVEDLGKPVSQNRYPVLAALFETGIRGLYKFAKDEVGFVPAVKEYLNQCELCNEIRNELFKQTKGFRELAPKGYYKEKK